MGESRLFTPLKIGNVEVKHRIGMAPLTRLRAANGHVPTPIMKEYYGQRASVPGTLLIAEGTFISPRACGCFPAAPGIWSEEQIAAWKPIVDEVHRKGSFIYLQLFAAGRAADAEVAKNEGIKIKAPSAIPRAPGSPLPEPLTIEEIKMLVEDFATAAKNAIRAGFDGVECHGANGYLIDQFLQDITNQRTDEYGGSVENRSRFAVEVLKAVSNAIGPERVGFRLSPFSPFGGMGMENPIPQFEDVIKKASQLNLGYLHLVEPRIAGPEDQETRETLDFAYRLWDGPILSAGGHDLTTAKKLVDEEHPDKNILVIFGRHFISNPDLVYRIREGMNLAAYDRSTFYTNDAVGYLDYAFSPEFVASQKGPVDLIEGTNNVEVVA
jgi:NADPH2 dehydrogenase